MSSPPPEGRSTRARRPANLGALGFAGVGVIVAIALAVRREGTIDVLTAVVLGMIEGLAEFLPVSSSGHLTVAERPLEDAVDAYVIAIQAGAILAVIVLYRARLRSLLRCLRARRAGVALGTSSSRSCSASGPVAAA